MKKALKANSAQSYISHQNKWKEMMLKMAQKTIHDREQREKRTQEKKE